MSGTGKLNEPGKVPFGIKYNSFLLHLKKMFLIFRSQLGQTLMMSIKTDSKNYKKYPSLLFT